MNIKNIIAVALTLAGSVSTVFATPLRAPQRGAQHRVKAPLPEITAPAQPSSFDLVSSLPEGAEAKTMVKSGACVIMIEPGYSIMQKIDGFVANVATADDKIYVGPIISQAGYPLSYMVGTVEDGVATFEFPQALGIYTLTNDKDYALIYNMTLNGNSFTRKIADEQVLKFSVGEDGSLSLLPDYYNCYIGDAYFDESEGKWYYCGLADVLMSCTPWTAEPMGFPEGAVLEEYNLVSGTQARKINVAVDGTDIYMSGIYGDLPESVIKGELKDGKAVFAGGQYLGIDDYFNSCVYVYPCDIERIEDPEYGDYDALTQRDGDFEFIVNDNLSEMTLGSSPIGFAPGKDMVGLFTYMESCTITKPDPTAEIMVAKPIIDSYYPPEGTYNAELYFYMLNISADDKVILDKDKLYWCLIIDDEPYPFEPDEYRGLTKTMDYLPYPYTNGRDIVYFPQYDVQGVVIYPEGYESLGVQAIYKDGDREFRSEVTYVVQPEPGEDSITDMGADLEVATEYFDLSGHKVSANGKGFLIKRSIDASGAVKITKIFK